MESAGEGLSMSAAVNAPATGIAPAATNAVPAPRAVIDYDFQSVLAAPPRQRLILWLLATLVALAAAALAIAHVDMIIAANGKIVTSDTQMVVQALETSVVRSVKVKPGDRVSAGTVL